MSNTIKIRWNEVDWKKIESKVFRIQRRIYKAKTDKTVNVVYYLQKKIITSIEGKLFSIREASKSKENYWIKSIYLTNSRKTIKLVYSSNLKKTITLNNNKIKNLKKLLINSETEINILVKDKAKQVLIKLALEAEWASKFELCSMGHHLGQSYQDTIENIFSKQIIQVEHSFQKDLFEGFKNFNNKRFLKKLNTIKIIKLQIEKWLNSNKMLEFKKSKLLFSTDFSFEKVQDNIIIPLIYDIALSGLETYLSQFVKNTLKNAFGVKKIKYVRYLDKVLILSEDLNILNQIILICEHYVNKLKLEFNTKKAKISKNTEGINFLGFQIIVIKRKNDFQKKISISKESKKLLLAKTRFIIQKNKSVSAYYLIRKLTPSIVSLGTYFQYYDCKKEFSQIDNRILNQLRAWVFRRKAQGKNRSFLKEKYFPSNKVFIYEGVKYKENWILTGEVQTSNNNNIKTFLPKLSWIKQKNYRTVKNNKSIYNGDYLYWSKRLIDIENDQRLLLQKQFLVEGKIEIYNFFATLKKNLWSK